MAPRETKIRVAKPGEVREINALESLERLSKRVESRIDVQKMLTALSPNGQIYARHLVVSGPSSLLSAAKALKITQEQVEAGLAELERGIESLIRVKF